VSTSDTKRVVSVVSLIWCNREKGESVFRLLPCNCTCSESNFRRETKIPRDNHWIKSISVEAHKRGLVRTTILIIMREVMTSYNNPGYGSMTLLPSMLWAECQLNCSVDDCDRDCLESRV